MKDTTPKWKKAGHSFQLQLFFLTLISFFIQKRQQQFERHKQHNKQPYWHHVTKRSLEGLWSLYWNGKKYKVLWNDTSVSYTERIGSLM